MKSKKAKLKSNRNLHVENMENFSFSKTIQTVLSTALIVASLFTLWTPANLFTGQIFDSMLFTFEDTESEVNATATPMMPNLRIGIVAGHWKDTQNRGYVCQDGLTEEQLNLRIATLVLQILSQQGYKVDLLEEFDSRLTQYKALALVSIHNDSCEYISDDATGFKVAPAMANSYPEDADRLVGCMLSEYKATTGMTVQTNKLTTDMTTYHTFNEVHSSTPVIIIETGYMNLDRQILTEQTERIANGIVAGLLCYIQDEQPEMEVTATP
jgi:N-acetylmuramoyl-L-alanine amidase